jgi:hypothetical protein
MLRPRAILTLVALAAASAAGCTPLGAVAGATDEAMQETADDLTFVAGPEEPILLAVAGPTAIDVESFGGDVEIIGGAETAHAIVTIKRRATHGYGRKPEAEASLAEIHSSVEVVPGDLGPRLQVRVWTTHAEPYFQRADVRIELPQVDGVHVVTDNGDVDLSYVTGRIDVRTEDGDVRVMTPLPLVSPVTILNDSGDIDYRVRGESTATFDCEAVRGQVFHRVEYGRLSVRSGTDHDTLLASLNGGSNAVELRTVDGNIRIAVVPDPMAVGMIIVE